MNLSRLGMGEDPVLSSTEFDGVFPVGETHTTDPPESSEAPNRFVLQLTSIEEEPPEHERPNVCYYNVEDIPIGTRDVLRDHLAAACAHKLHMTQEEWNMVTTYLSTVNNKPRRRSHHLLENLVHQILTDTTLMLMKLFLTPWLHSICLAITLRKSSCLRNK
jgi:hypothetical protein